jgi:hypothetical protein
MPSSAAFGPPLTQRPNYARPAAIKPLAKGARGDHEIERREKRAKVKTHEQKEKAASKKVAPGCRWPKFDHDTKRHVCTGQLESAHKVAVGMGGDKTGERTNRQELLTVCTHIHTDSPEGIERHGRKWKPLDKARGSFGPVAFYRRYPLEGRKVSYVQFWLIWCERAGGNAPTRKHFSRTDAITEAERLARNNPGQRFWILKSEEAAEFQAVKWEKAHKEDCACNDCIPF